MNEAFIIDGGVNYDILTWPMERQDVYKRQPVNRLGNAMHEQPGRVFFTRARGVVNTARNKNAALALSLIHI